MERLFLHSQFFILHSPLLISMRKQLYVIAYDIQDDKTRTQTADLLQAAGGIRRNLSVFECMFSAPVRKRVLREIQALIDVKTDSVLCYKVCRACYVHTQYIPEDCAPPKWDEIVVI